MKQENWQGTLDNHIHAMIDAGYTDIYVSNVQRQCPGINMPQHLRGYYIQIDFNKPSRKKED